MNILLAISVTIQSIPATKPSPVTAEHAIIPQCLVSIESSSRYSLICCRLRDYGMSYLLPFMKS